MFITSKISGKKAASKVIKPQDLSKKILWVRASKVAGWQSVISGWSSKSKLKTRSHGEFSIKSCNIWHLNQTQLSKNIVTEYVRCFFGLEPTLSDLHIFFKIMGGDTSAKVNPGGHYLRTEHLAPATEHYQKLQTYKNVERLPNTTELLPILSLSFSWLNLRVQLVVPNRWSREVFTPKNMTSWHKTRAFGILTIQWQFKTVTCA